MSVLLTSVKNTFLEAFEESSPIRDSDCKQRSRSCSELPDDVFACQGTMEPPALQPRQRGYNAGGICTVGLPQASGYTMVVKNTFFEVKEDGSPKRLRRCQSDGDIQAPAVPDRDMDVLLEPDEVPGLDGDVPKPPSEVPRQHPTRILPGQPAVAPMPNPAFSMLPSQVQASTQGAACHGASIASFAAALGASFALGMPFTTPMWSLPNMVAQAAVNQAQFADETDMPVTQITPVKSKRRRGRRSGRATPKDVGTVSSITPEKLDKRAASKMTKPKTPQKAPQGLAAEPNASSAASVPLPVGWVKAPHKAPATMASLGQRLEAFQSQRAQPRTEVAPLLASSDSSSSSSEDELSGGEQDRVYAELHARIQHQRKQKFGLPAPTVRRQAA